MTRVKRGNVARKRRKKILKLAKGFRGSHSTIFSHRQSASDESIAERLS